MMAIILRLTNMISLIRPYWQQMLFARSMYTSLYYFVVRAKIVLMAAAGLDNQTIGERLSLPRQIVSKWRKRFFEERLEGLEDIPRAGRPSDFSP